LMDQCKLMAISQEAMAVLVRTGNALVNIVFGVLLLRPKDAIFQSG